MHKLIKKYKMAGKHAQHRDALIRSMIIELVRAEKIKTTPSKAKIVKSQFDRLVTHAKRDSASGRKVVTSFFASNDRIITKFYSLVESNFGDRTSGYTHTVRTLPRKGDNADQMYIMVVNYKERDKKSRVQKLLEKRKETEEKKSVSGRVKKAVKKVAKPKTEGNSN